MDLLVLNEDCTPAVKKLQTSYFPSTSQISGRIFHQTLRPPITTSLEAAASKPRKSSPK
ncbi:hypothetical protein NPIL_625381, partial [Nephila pilipes]